jgi:hypothetical protein
MSNTVNQQKVNAFSKALATAWRLIARKAAQPRKHRQASTPKAKQPG